MGWVITLGVLAVLAMLPLGASVKYNSDGFLAKVILGPLKITVFPRPKKEKKKEDKADPKPKAEEQMSAAPAAPQNPPLPPAAKQKGKETGGSLLDFLPLVKVALDLLGDLRRKLRLDRLELKLIMAADDPCDLAVSYGRAWAALGNLMPQLERLFVIKKRDVEVACDFAASETRVIAHLELTITLGRLLSLVVVYAIRALMEYLKISKKRKGGAVT